MEKHPQHLQGEAAAGWRRRREAPASLGAAAPPSPTASYGDVPWERLTPWLSTYRPEQICFFFLLLFVFQEFWGSSFPP